MEQISEPEWAYDIPTKVVLPFPIKEEKTSSDEESEPISQPSKQHKSMFADKQGEKLQEQDCLSVVKKKRERTRFNVFQRAELEKAFIDSPYLAPKQRLAIAARLGVKPVAVQSWFKNRRFKWRKEAREGSDSPSESLPQIHPSPKVYLPAMYQSSYVYNPGHISMDWCQGCYTGQPTKKAYSPFLSISPLLTKWGNSY